MTAGTAPSLHGRPAHYATGLVDVAPGTCAWLQPNGDWSESNAGLVIGDGAAALIDTAWDLPLTRRILAAAGDRTTNPITTLVATHGDGDHVNGLQLIPQAELIASTGTAADMADERPASLRRAQVGARALHRFGAGPARRFGRYVAPMLGPFDFRGITLRAPDRTFDRNLTIAVGGRTVELVRLGPAHTSGDTIAYLPDCDVVFAGDLLFTGVTHNAWSGTIHGWRRALEAIGALSPSVIVPGHGPLSGIDDLQRLDDYWHWIEHRAGHLLGGGATVYDAARRIVLSDDFARQPWGSWVCPERTVLNVEIVARGLAATYRPISHRQRPRLMWQVARLHDELTRHAEAGVPPAK